MRLFSWLGAASRWVWLPELGAAGAHPGAVSLSLSASLSGGSSSEGSSELWEAWTGDAGALAQIRTEGVFDLLFPSTQVF